MQHVWQGAPRPCSVSSLNLLMSCLASSNVAWQAPYLRPRQRCRECQRYHVLGDQVQLPQGQQAPQNLLLRAQQRHPFPPSAFLCHGTCTGQALCQMLHGTITSLPGLSPLHRCHVTRAKHRPLVSIRRQRCPSLLSQLGQRCLPSLLSQQQRLHISRICRASISRICPFWACEMPFTAGLIDLFQLFLAAGGTNLQQES